LAGASLDQETVVVALARWQHCSWRRFEILEASSRSAFVSDLTVSICCRWAWSWWRQTSTTTSSHDAWRWTSTVW